jgi:AcrR family transcriptional regulator
MRRALSDTDLRQFRNRVCAAATELFGELGYDGFNMRKLAAYLGVSAMTAYRYFEGKTEILTAVRARAFDALAKRLETVSDLSGSRLDRFVAVCRVYVDFAREEPIRYRLMFDLSQPQVARSAELVCSERRAYEAFVDHVRSFVDPRIQESCCERFARILWASLHGIVALTLMETYGDSELDGLLHETIHRFAASSSHKSGDGFAQHVPVREPHVVPAESLNGATIISPDPLTPGG